MRFLKGFVGMSGLLFLWGCGAERVPGPLVATHLEFVQTPSDTIVNRQLIAKTPIVRFVDDDGKTAPSSSEVAVTVSTGMPVQEAAVNAVNGIATFAAVKVSATVGKATLTFSSAGLPSISFPVVVIAGTPANISVVSGNNQTGVVGDVLAVPLVVRVSDADGNPIPGAVVTFSTIMGDGHATNPQPVTGVDGAASTTFVLSSAAGPNSVAVALRDLPSVSTQIVATATPRKFIHLFAGGDRTCGERSDGIDFCWGASEGVPIGDGAEVDRSLPTQIGGGGPMGFLTVGATHMCNKTHCWGSNEHGQLGDGTFIKRLLPTLIMTGDGYSRTSARFVVAGRDHTCGVNGGSTGGLVFCWGNNAFGQLGDSLDSRVSRNYPSLVGIRGSSTNANVLALGSSHTCGGGICWGKNDEGQLGDGTSVSRSRPKQVASDIWADLYAGNGSPQKSSAAGAQHSCALTSTGKAYCWGSNAFGQLGNSSSGISAIPTEVNTALRFTAIVAGEFFTCALAAKLYCWGANTYGQLGNGTFNNSSTLVEVNVPGPIEVAAGASHICVLTDQQTTLCWGRNHRGQLGDGTALTRTQPAPTK